MKVKSKPDGLPKDENRIRKEIRQKNGADNEI